MVREAASAGLAGLSLTDHDTVVGLEEAADEAARLGLRFVMGTEISANEPGRSVHILAFGFDPGHAPLLEFLQMLTEDRVRRAREIVARLGEAGAPLSYEAVERQCGQAAPTRAHVARALLAEALVPNLDAAFQRFLKRGRPCFVEKRPTPPAEVIAQVHGAGGVAVLAHPGRTHGEREIRRWSADGLDGVEIRHPENSPAVRKRLESLARRLDLLRSGGSDWHGPHPGRAPVGQEKVPIDWLDAIEERAGSRG